MSFGRKTGNGRNTGDKDHMEAPALISRYQVGPYKGGNKKLDQVAIAFQGSPRPSGDQDKVLLLSDPLSRQAMLYEFRSADIVYAEEVPSISMPNGTAMAMVRLWIKRGSTGLKIVPFVVEDTSINLSQYL